MTVLTSLARIEAADRGRAQIIRTRRHVHLSGRPLVFIPLELAGEACAPLAAMVGDDPSAPPRLLVVGNPLNRDERFAFAAGLAGVMLGYITSFTGGPQPADEAGPGAEPLPDAPQLIVPNASGVTFTRLLGRSTRFRPTDGPWAVPAPVSLLGKWLTFYTERFQHSASSLLLAATGAVSAHWATGQSATEDQNLAALLAWISPPAGLTGQQAALLAEDPARCPPAGPATDPEFDKKVLFGRLAAIREARLAGDAAFQQRAEVLLERELRAVLAPTWTLMWEAIGLLRSLPEAGHVADRWKADRKEFTRYARYLSEGGLPQAKRDNAVSAARKLAWLESEQQQLEAQLAYDDELVMAEYRMTGEAFKGEVTKYERCLDESGKRVKLRPLIWVDTADEVAMEAGTEVRSPVRPAQKAVIQHVEPLGDARTRVCLELQNDMGRGLTPADGSVPEVGEVRCYTTLKLDFQPSPEFPRPEDTPWTHGGPPQEYVPTDDDSREAWDGQSWADEAFQGDGT
jgi:hypothetical protein